MNVQKILVTGGAGYIGSHTVLLLLEAGYNIVVLDNLCNSNPESLKRVQQITGRSLDFVQGDIRHADDLDAVFKAYQIDAVIHFAGLKAVGESMQQPIDYFDNNINGTIQLLKAMQKAQVHILVFSSSATVYGEKEQWQLNEDMPTGMPTNNYGYTKLIVEHMLEKLSVSDAKWSIANLRYFNPIGAHESGLIGEDPNGIPNNLLPFVSQVAVGKLPCLNVFGDDYPTPDGTAIRDYIHVMDLAKGHIKALEYLQQHHGNFIWNLGTGNGISVKQIIDKFEQVTNVKVNYQIAPRRAGDIAACWANVDKARHELNWKAEYGLERMVIDLWRWQSQNPNGYNLN